jgi:hypothetical protein
VFKIPRLLQKLLTLLFIPFAFSSCFISLSKKSTDKITITFIKQNPELIKQAVEYSILATLGEKPNDFKADDIVDPEMRKKIKSLCNTVNVSYKITGYGEIPDSNVVFKTITLFGVTEVVYDFSATEREFRDNTSNPKDYYFIKVSDRTYYRRKPVPIM